MMRRGPYLVLESHDIEIARQQASEAIEAARAIWKKRGVTLNPRIKAFRENNEDPASREHQ